MTGWLVRTITGLGIAIALGLLSISPSYGQDSVTSVSKEVNKRMVKLYGAGGFKGLPSYGTGILVSEYGHILTVNNHILSTADLRVHLADGRVFHNAKVIAREPELDVALIKMDEPLEKLPHFNFAEEAAKPVASPGTLILAFSNQFSIATRDEPMSVQHGVLSAFTELRGRRGDFAAAFSGKAYFIDIVACNPGSAGGALTDRKGRLLGILGRELKNKLSDTWINYAVPIQAWTEIARGDKNVKVTMADFVRDGMAGKYIEGKKKILVKGKGGFHGIVLVPNPVTNTPPFVDGVLPDSPAAKAGLRPDDLIVYVDGELVQSVSDFRQLMNSYNPDDEVRFDVQRGAQLETFTIKLAKQPKIGLK